MIVAAAEVPPSVSIKESSRIGGLKSNTSIAIHTYKTQKKNHSYMYLHVPQNIQLLWKKKKKGEGKH
jgi:hypothetical protein